VRHAAPRRPLPRQGPARPRPCSPPHRPRGLAWPRPRSAAAPRQGARLASRAPHRGPRSAVQGPSRSLPRQRLTAFTPRARTGSLPRPALLTVCRRLMSRPSALSATGSSPRVVPASRREEIRINGEDRKGRKKI
jgi:hypothetical protein